MAWAQSGKGSPVATRPPTTSPAIPKNNKYKGPGARSSPAMSARPTITHSHQANAHLQGSGRIGYGSTTKTSEREAVRQLQPVSRDIEPNFRSKVMTNA